MNVRNSLITSSVDFEAEGLHHGVLRIPYSSDRSAYGFIPVPLWVAKSGEGPTVLLTGANHGDEYEGPVALTRLLHEGLFETIKGRVIVIPALNYPAYRAGRRTSPIDNANLNRVFPGKRDGSVTEMLAHYVETVLLPMADVAIDLHSGGSSLNYLPTLMTFQARSDEERAQLDKIVRGFGAPRELVMDLSVEDRMMGAAAQRHGVVFMTGEFGGGATVSPAGVEIVIRGVRGVLAALGMIPLAPEASVERTVERLDVKPIAHYLHATESGVFEPLFVLGDMVREGQLAGRLYDPEQPWRKPAELHFSGAGIVVCIRTFALVEVGDCLAHLASVTRG